MSTTCTGNICRPLFEKLSHNPAEAVQYLGKEGFVIRPSAGMELGINAIVHMLVLFTALTFLFLFVISKVETRAMEQEFVIALRTNLEKALDAGNISSHGVLKSQLTTIKPVLHVLRTLYDTPDPTTVAFNEGLFRNAYLIMGILFSVFLTLIATIAYGAGVPVMRLVFFVVLSNMFLFMIIGAVEFVFFTHVAKKFIPTKPSTVTKNIIQDLKNEFNGK